jgi:hypothetical protein
MGYTRVVAERRRFWGREAELALVREAVKTTLKGGATRAFYIHGLGGVGKSALLRECGNIAAEAGVRVAQAVHQAMRDYRHAEKLALNPLRRSRLLVDDSTPARLQALLREALDGFKAVRRDEKFHRALFHTFFEPAPTQEAAAERLGLPFNTYRYQLARGTERLVEWLWRRELGR